MEVFVLDYLTEAEAARLAGFSPKTLRNWRYLGTGPKYRKLSPGRGGRIRYRRSDVEQWLDSQAIAA
ncbi:helix-turn-helix transcriptional regulator [Kitasatospora sp. NPDC101235]|uniref:helix-turn-helix transcriptional regulator n=1 Tax=Kitasatospora sp. NPDC101235 TaxID=3364101 RepID=UPI0038302F7D